MKAKRTAEGQAKQQICFLENGCMHTPPCVNYFANNVRYVDEEKNPRKP